MKAVCLFTAAALSALGQGQLLSPGAEFDLVSGAQSHRHGRTRPFFEAAPSGLTLVLIGENYTLLTSADLDGHIRHSRSDLAAVRAQIDGALLRPDGSVWLVSTGPYDLTTNFGGTPIASNMGRIAPRTPLFDDLDLYNPAGEHVTSFRLLSPDWLSESPIAASGDEIVLRSSAHAVGLAVSQSEILHFGTVAGGQFHERAQVPVSPPAFGAIPLLASNGDLLLVQKASGAILAIDPSAGGGPVVHAGTVHPVQAAALDSDQLYLFSGDTAARADLAGHVLATWRLQFSPGFKPAALGVTGGCLYLVDMAGRVERFPLP
jgi:hypothetical protein